jgi:hypothetical protein
MQRISAIRRVEAIMRTHWSPDKEARFNRDYAFCAKIASDLREEALPSYTEPAPEPASPSQSPYVFDMAVGITSQMFTTSRSQVKQAAPRPDGIDANTYAAIHKQMVDAHAIVLATNYQAERIATAIEALTNALYDDPRRR